MEPENTVQLKNAIEAGHGGKSSFLKSVRVHAARDRKAGWDGLVHVFDLKNNPKASRVYAWSSPITGSTKPRFFAVLHMGEVTGPVEAVKAASAAIRKWGPRGSGNKGGSGK
jgi:hypothetical protein